MQMGVLYFCQVNANKVALLWLIWFNDVDLSAHAAEIGCSSQQQQH